MNLRLAPITLLLLLVGACSGNGKDDLSDTGTPTGDDDDTVGDDDDDDDDDDTTLNCEVAVANDLPDLYAENVEGREHYCESQPLYNPDQKTSNTFIVGEYEIDDCGNILGGETMYIFPNAEWAESDGAADCSVHWNCSGIVDDPQAAGTYGMALNCAIDEANSDCVVIFDLEDLQTFSIHYDVTLIGDKTTWAFASGTIFGEGYGNESHVSFWLDKCDLL